MYRVRVRKAAKAIESWERARGRGGGGLSVSPGGVAAHSRAEVGGDLEHLGAGQHRRVTDGSYNYNHFVQTQGIWHTRLLFHSTDDSSLLSESGSQEKGSGPPLGGACSSSW